jgi:hypothetical protein
MASANRPGVIVVQELSETPAAVTAPTLNPVVIAPCYQIIEALESNGSLNDDARHAAQKYQQAAMTITQAEFPDPRDNIEEIDVLEDEVGLRIYYGGLLTTLARGSHSSTGSAFLASANGSCRPALLMTEREVGAEYHQFGSTGQNLLIAVNRQSNVTYHTVVLTGDMTPEQVADEINAVVEVAEVLDEDNTYGIPVTASHEALLLASTGFGAGASVSISGAAAATLGMASAVVWYRVAGSGFYGLDDGDGDLTTPWISWSRGSFTADGVDATWTGVAYLIDQSGVADDATAPAMYFSGPSETIPLRAATATTDGDEFWVNGVQYGGAVVTRVEATRFKLGVLDTARSAYSSTGTLTSAVYTTIEVGILANTNNQFAPKYAYFIANNLVFGEVTPEGEAASITGSVAGLDAQPAVLLGGASVISFAAVLSGSTFALTLTEDGVQGAEQVVTFSGSYANLTAVAADLTEGLTGVTASVFSDGTDNRIKLSTTATGADQSFTLSTGTDASIVEALGFSNGDEGVGKDVEFAVQAVIQTAPVNYAGELTTTENWEFVLTDSRGTDMTWSVEVAFVAGETLHDIAARISQGVALDDGGYPMYLYGASGAFQIGTLRVYDNGGTHLSVGDETDEHGYFTITTVEGGPSVVFSVTEALDGTVLGISGANLDVQGDDSLAGSRLLLTLDNNPVVVDITFESNSLSEAIDLINADESISGSIDVASESAGKMVITSAVAGASSVVAIDSAGSAAAELGLSGSATGSGRPNPDFYLDGDGSLQVGANILRNRSTGTPYGITPGSGADLYIEYRGLRLDVSAAAEDPALLSFNDITTMIAAIGPVSTDNPLALACSLMLQNAPSQTCSALGISAVSAAAPLGTVTAHLAALTFLESKDVYTLAPMTDDPFVQQLYATHVESMSQPEERGERIVFIWQGQPSRGVDTSISSGSGASVESATAVNLGSNPTDGIVGAGLDPSDLSVADGLYLEMVTVALGETSIARYSVSSQASALTTIRTSFSAGQNDDGFYTEVDLTDDVGDEGITFTLKVRGDELLITGTQLPDYPAIAETAASQGESYSNRRVFMLYCDEVDVSLDGVVTAVPGYYVSAAIAGMIAEQAPQQPFTRVSLTGFSQVYGTDSTYSENQLDTIADGGRYVMVNQGGRIASRHQRSTASISIEARELSITKAIDFLAKGLRATNRAYIGRYVINPGFIDQLVMSNTGYLARVARAGVVNAAHLKSVLQDSNAPDTVLVEVEVAPAYPCNTIRITIVS